MCIHSQRNRLVAVSQYLRNTCYISTVGNGNIGEGMAQLVRMQIGYIAALGELFQVARGALRVHRLRAALLREHKSAHRFLCLLYAELTQEIHRVIACIDNANTSAFGRVKIDTFRRCIAKVSGNPNFTCFEIYILPFESAALTPADAGINQKSY